MITGIEQREADLRIAWAVSLARFELDRAMEAKDATVVVTHLQAAATVLAHEAEVYRKAQGGSDAH